MSRNATYYTVVQIRRQLNRWIVDWQPHNTHSRTMEMLNSSYFVRLTTMKHPKCLQFGFISWSFPCTLAAPCVLCHNVVIFMILLTKQMSTNCVCVCVEYSLTTGSLFFRLLSYGQTQSPCFRVRRVRRPNSKLHWTYILHKLLRKVYNVYIQAIFFRRATVYMSNIEFWFIEPWNHETKA